MTQQQQITVYQPCREGDHHVCIGKDDDEATRPANLAPVCECDCHRATCGTCGRSWNFIKTPTPAGRCPFEYEHTDDEPSAADALRALLDELDEVHVYESDVAGNWSRVQTVRAICRDVLDRPDDDLAALDPPAEYHCGRADHDAEDCAREGCAQ